MEISKSKINWKKFLEKVIAEEQSTWFISSQAEGVRVKYIKGYKCVIPHSTNNKQYNFFKNYESQNSKGGMGDLKKPILRQGKGNHYQTLIYIKRL